jgi:hypothetical protein
LAEASRRSRADGLAAFLTAMSFISLDNSV